jgi:signal transduction histidine kinase
MRIRLEQGTWLTLWLVLATVVPAGVVLWFMIEASRLDAESSRRALADAYRGQLQLVAVRVSDHWTARAAALRREVPHQTPADFETLVLSGAADAYVFLGADGAVVYPSPLGGSATPPVRADPASQIARRRQAELRELSGGGRRLDVLALIARHFSRGPLVSGVDEDGRIIAADAQMLGLTLLPPGTAAWTRQRDALAARLRDYGAPMPSSQRMFLMGEVAAVAGQPDLFPTLAAERLAARFLEADRPGHGEPSVLAATATPGVWQLPSPDGRVVALFRAETVRRHMQSLVPGSEAGQPRLVVSPPSARPPADSISVGAAVPGWHLGFRDGIPASAGSRQAARWSYIAGGVVAICAVVVLMAGAAGLLRRQFQVASMKTGLVSAVSHELRTPLASMRLLVDNLLDDATVQPEKTRDYLLLMAAENSRLTRVVDNFLTYARLERGRAEPSLSPVDPRDVIAGAVLTFTRLRGDRPSPTVETSPSTPEVLGDRDALVTALLNLLDNAYKYTADTPDVRVAVRASGAHVELSVSDNGVGVPPAERARIFSQFYRVDQALASATHGVGLGLHIVRRIVQAHGGTVDVAPRPGGGSIFTMTLPAFHPEAGA